MDEDFEFFLETMGPPFAKQGVPDDRIGMYRGRLPDQLLSYWKEHGWSGYAEGLFWTVDPSAYEPVLEAWIGDTQFAERDAYHVIARSAFGALYCWGERTGFSLKIFAPGSFCIPRVSRLVGPKAELGIRTFFSGQSPEANDFDGLFEGARSVLGRLAPDEMYGFVPALALGGQAKLDNLKKVKAIEHLVILAQLSELRVMKTSGTA